MLLVVGVCFGGYRKARRGERKGLGSRETGFDAGKGCGRTGKQCLSAIIDTWLLVADIPRCLVLSEVLSLTALWSVTGHGDPYRF